MSEEFTVEMNTVEFEEAMQRLRKGVKAGFIDPQYGLLSVQTRLLAERCQDFTPPRNIGQGRVAVARDLSVIFRPLSQATFTDPGIKMIVRTDDRPAWEKVAQTFKGAHNLQNTRAIGFSPDWHAKNRISRGRGRRAKSGNIGVVTLGVEGRAARSYIKEVQKRVGWARAGWNMGIIAFGGFVTAPWMSRHGLNRGSVVDGRASPEPFIHVINDTSWAKYGSMGEGNRILQNAGRARARDMESYYFRMMNLAADQAQGVAA
jgi:hypothetical protein